MSIKEQTNMSRPHVEYANSMGFQYGSLLLKHGTKQQKEEFTKLSHEFRKKLALKNQKLYRETNKEKIAEREKLHREQNKEKIAERKKLYRQQKKEAEKANKTYKQYKKEEEEAQQEAKRLAKEEQQQKEWLARKAEQFANEYILCKCGKYYQRKNENTHIHRVSKNIETNEIQKPTKKIIYVYSFKH